LSHRTAIIALLALAASAGGASAQTALFSNRSSDPATPALGASPVTTSGVPAPAGAMWSEAPRAGADEANAVAGFSAHGAGLSAPYRFADDFTILGPSAWRLQSVTLYAYQSDAPLGASPFAGVNLRIWNGVPDAPGSRVLVGDTETNRLLTSVPAEVYRILNTSIFPAAAADTTRMLWETVADTSSVTLLPGTYWLDWQFTPSDPLRHAFAPPTTTAGSRGPEGANALQLRPGIGGEPEWAPVVDAGKPRAADDVPQELPFILRGAAICAADFNADGAANSQDFFDFLSEFFATAPGADFNHDSAVNSQDFFDFLTAFFACG
jgi:hypothetical protein